MTNILETIAAATRERVASQRAEAPLEAISEQARKLAEAELAQNDGKFPLRFRENLAPAGVSFICEVKKASPSKGIIASDFPYVEIARDYERGGAAAISCLTEPQWFLGADKYLREIAREVSLPVLRKDFVVDEYMIYQAKVLGAAAVLLIAAILSDAQLARYIRLADELGLSTLVEAHSEDEIQRALAAGARIIGVNNRNLADFSVDFGNAQRLRKLIPDDVLYVAESGVTSADDVRAVAEAGVDAVLVGEALMRAPRRADKLAEFRAAAQLCEQLHGKAGI